MGISKIKGAVFAAAACILAAGSCHHDKDMTDTTGVATGGTCGTIAGLTCASPDDYCAMPEGSCRIADNAGTCTVKPTVIPAIFQPVCGCDSQTYSNSSAAAAAGINVLSPGACVMPN